MQLSQQQVFTASHAVHKANPYRTAPPVTANSMRSHNRNCHPLHLPWAHRRGPWAAAPGRSLRVSSRVAPKPPADLPVLGVSS